jgi:hypothetical protein
MLQMRAIEDADLPVTAELLTRGFPSRTRAFWDIGLARIADYCRSVDGGPIGQLLVADGSPVGVLLAIKSTDMRGGPPIVNLSSWFVEEKYRWFAPRMLQKSIVDPSLTYTDISPSPEAVRLNTHLGFRMVPEKLLLFALPWAWATGKRTGKVIPFDRIPGGALNDDVRQRMAGHVALGCLAAAVEAGGRYHPLIFNIVPRKKIPVARLILAESATLVADNIGGIAGFLLARGIGLMMLQVGKDMKMPGAIVWKDPQPFQVKGTWDDGRIDQTYSETVFLRT